MGIYASSTDVSSEKSKIEIERTLRRYGAQKFASGWDKDKAVIVFQMGNRRIRFYLPLPEKDAFRKTTSGRTRTNESVEQAWEQAGRQRWRALALAIKGKLESVESGITSFERAFLDNIVMPNGKNLGDMIVPQIAEAYEKKKMPLMLSMGE